MHNLNAIIAIAFRDLTKLFRDRGRVVASLIFPVVFIGIFGTTLQANLQDAVEYNFLTFVFTGVLAQTLFQSTAAGIISLVEDRQNDFAQEMFVSPISRVSIILGKIVGETLVSLFQILGVIAFGFVIGLPIAWQTMLALIPIMLVIAAFGGTFGVIIMSNLKDQRTANQVFPFLIFPQFFLAGVFNPVKVMPLPLLIASRVSPMTYAVDFLRSIYYIGRPEYSQVVLFNPWFNLVVLSSMATVFMFAGTYIFIKNERNR